MEFLNLILMFSFISVSLPIKESSRIYDGRECEAKEFPSLVAFTNRFGPLCGGTILSKLRIVTAAHCYPENLSRSICIIAGEIRIDHQASNSRQRVKIRKIVIHPNYNKSTFKNDVAILILLEPLKLNSETVSAVHLSSQSPKIGTEAIAAGWRLTEGSQWKIVCKVAKVTVFIRAKCKMKASEQNINFPSDVVAVENATSYKQAFITPDKSQICTGDITDTIGSYGSDTGGSLFVMDQHNELKFVGIISYIKNSNSTIAVYTDIAYHRNWIEEVIENAASNNVRMCVVVFSCLLSIMSYCF